MEPPLKKRRLEPLPRSLVLGQIEKWLASENSPKMKIAIFDASPEININKVIDHVLPFLGVKLLKSCRLVSKLWNNAASNCLKNQTAVYLKIRAHTDMDERLSKLISDGAKLGLPFPFKFYRLDVADNFKITTKCFLTGKSCYVDHFKIQLRNSNEDYILESNFRYLTRLCLSSFGPLTTRLTNWKPPKLEKLKYLTISQNHKYFSNVFLELVQSVLFSSAVLKGLEILNCDMRIVTGILTSSNLQSIESVRVDLFQECISDCSQLFLQAPFSNLKSLELYSKKPEDDIVVFEMIKTHASTLQSLSIKLFDTPEGSAVRLQNLTTMVLTDWGGYFGFFKPEITPSLKIITFRRPKLPLSCAPQSFVHENVESLCIVPGESAFDVGMTIDEFQALMTLLTTNFPNIRRLVFNGLPNDVNGQENKVVSFTTRSFPKLEEFVCRGCSWDLSQDNKENVSPMIKKHYTKNSIELSSVPLKLSLCGWSNLKKLDISATSLSEREIQSISFIPSLESFGFYWNGTLSAEVVAKFLQKLKILTIKNCCKPIYIEPMEKLWTLHPFVKCGCKRASNIQV